MDSGNRHKKLVAAARNALDAVYDDFAVADHERFDSLERLMNHASCLAGMAMDAIEESDELAEDMEEAEEEEGWAT